MRLFKMTEQSSFVEFSPQNFAQNHTEETLESWLEQNPEAILDDGGVLVIGRQVMTSFGAYIDMLGLDREGNVVVIELKRERTPRETLAQALEYAAFAEKLTYGDLEETIQKSSSGDFPDLQEAHQAYFNLDSSDAVSFNKDQRIVVIGSPVTDQIRTTAAFLGGKGVRVACVEFAFFETDTGERLISMQTVVQEADTKSGPIQTSPVQITNRESFMGDSNENGRKVFTRFLDLAQRESMTIRWGGKGFTANVIIDGVYVPIFMGYPTSCFFGQSLWSCFYLVGSKISNSEQLIDDYYKRFTSTGIFVPAGREVKWIIGDGDIEHALEEAISIFTDLRKEVMERGLRE